MTHWLCEACLQLKEAVQAHNTNRQLLSSASASGLGAQRAVATSYLTAALPGRGCKVALSIVSCWILKQTCLSSSKQQEQVQLLQAHRAAHTSSAINIIEPSWQQASHHHGRYRMIGHQPAKLAFLRTACISCMRLSSVKHPIQKAATKSKLGIVVTDPSGRPCYSFLTHSHLHTRDWDQSSGHSVEYM